MSNPRPERGGAWDFHGRITPEYAPDHDGEPDPGEVVWTWVPYEEDPEVGKDRPLVVVGRAVDDPSLLVGLMLSSKHHDGDGRWHPVGTGAWDGEHRPSWVRVDRPLAVTEGAVRREGSALDRRTFLDVVEHAAAATRGPAGGHRPQPRAHPGPAARRVDRLVGVYRANGGPRGELAYVLGKLVGRAHCALCDVTHSPLRRKAEWDRMATALGVPFDLLHLDECTGELHRLVPSKAEAPVVLAEAGGRLEVVLGPSELDALGGSVTAFAEALHGALARHGLALPR
ncbi:MAG: type II toxin-antitoxin system PemK/MazF family toxin [Candidatus Nanopelagicales bacterium]